MLLADDLAPGCTGFEGNPDVRTPRLDELAAGGLVFSRAYVPLPQCAPSRAALLTGQWPHSLGVLTNRGADLPPGRVTCAELLRDAGYRTGFVGKWHLDGVRTPSAGFDDFWRPFVTARYRDPATWTEEGRAERNEGHATEVACDLALQFVDGSPEPFFLWVSFKAPHRPHDGPLDPELEVDPAQVTLPANLADDLEDKPAAQREGAPHREFLARDPAELREETAAYYGLIGALDRAVGRLLDGLAERGRLERTLVLFLSDNGWLRGQHRMVTKGDALYEELVRVPFVASWPGRVAPGRSDALVSTLDVLPTLAEAAGLGVPAADGRSLWPLLHGGRPPERDELLLEYWKKRPGDDPVPILGLVTPRWKYTRYLASGEEELYDLERDPGERVNLAHGDAGGEAGSLADLRARLEARRRALPPPLGPAGGG